MISLRALDLEVELLSPWHVSSGRGAGPSADLTVVRSPAGLPYLPGRTLRGLLRDALFRAEELGRVEAGRTERLFGTWTFGENAPGRRETTPGLLIVDSATLPDEYERYAAAHPRWAEAFIDTVAATALEDGVALDHTLRVFEVAVPMTLRARVEGPEGDPWAEDLRKALPWLRGLGLLRSRGYGRVRVRFANQEEVLRA